MEAKELIIKQTEKNVTHCFTYPIPDLNAQIDTLNSGQFTLNLSGKHTHDSTFSLDSELSSPSSGPHKVRDKVKQSTFAPAQTTLKVSIKKRN